MKQVFRLLGLVFLILFASTGHARLGEDSSWTRFSSGVVEPRFGGYYRSQWIFHTIDRLHVYSATTAEPTSVPLKPPAGWKKVKLFALRKSGDGLRALAYGPAVKGQIEFRSLSLEADGSFEADATNSFSINGKTAVAHGVHANSAEVGETRPVHDLVSMTSVYSPDSNWFVLLHVSPGAKSERNYTFYLLDRKFALVKSYTLSQEHKTGMRHFCVDNAGTIYFAVSVVEPTSDAIKRYYCQSVQLYSREQQASDFMLETLSEKNFAFRDIRFIPGDAGGTRLVVLGGKTDDDEPRIGSLSVYRKSGETGKFVSEHRLSLWKNKHEIAGAFQAERGRLMFRLRGGFIKNDELFISFDDMTNPLTGSSSYSSTSGNFEMGYVSFGYLAHLSPVKSHIDCFVLNRYISSSALDYQTFFNSQTRQVTHVFNDSQDRYGPKVKYEDAVEKALQDGYSPKITDVVGGCVYTPGKGFRMKLVYDNYDNAPLRINAAWRACNLGNSMCLIFLSEFVNQSKQIKLLPCVVQL